MIGGRGLSFFNEIEQYSGYSAFPPIGNLNVLYIDAGVNALYRWTGSAYEEIGRSVIFGYQDFAAGEITTTTAIVDSNDNGTNARFLIDNINPQASIVDASDPTEYVYTAGVVGFFSRIVAVNLAVKGSNSLTITLNKIPDPTTPVRIYYPYLGATPAGYEVPPQNILDAHGLLKLEGQVLVPADVINEAYNSTTNKPVSANQVKLLNERVDGLTPDDITGFNEAVDDEVNALIQDSANSLIVWAYDDVLATLTPTFNYNTTNLKITAGELDTIQSIAVGAAPSLLGTNFTSIPQSAVINLVSDLADKQNQDNLLDSISTLSGNGIIVRKNGNDAETRQIVAGSSKISITNGNGVSANPTIDLGTVAISDITDLQTTLAGKQPLNQQLTDIAGLTPADSNIIVGNGITWAAESGATARTSLGLGSIATQNANSIAITGGNLSGISKFYAGSSSQIQDETMGITGNTPLILSNGSSKIRATFNDNGSGYESYLQFGTVLDSNHIVNICRYGTNKSSIGQFAIYATETYISNNLKVNSLTASQLVASDANKNLVSGNLSGDVSSSGLSTAIGASKVTNTMLAGSIDQSKITNLTSDLASKEPTITAGTSAQYWRGDKSWQQINFTDLAGSIAVGQISNASITYAKIQNVSATGRLLGRNSAGAGQIEEITTIPSTILSNSSLYIGTTQIALNRSSSTQNLTGITSIDGYLTKSNTGRTGNISYISPTSQADWSNYPVGLGTMVNANKASVGAATNDFNYFYKLANRDVAGGWGGITLNMANGKLYSGRTDSSSNYATWKELAFLSGSDAITVTSDSDTATLFNAASTAGSIGLMPRSAILSGGGASYVRSAIVGRGVVGTQRVVMDFDTWNGGGGEEDMKNVRIYSQGNVMLRLNDKGVYIGANTGANAALELKAGTTSLAPLKLNSGNDLTTAQAGAFEFGSSRLAFTPSGTTRKRVVLTGDSAPVSGQIPVGNGTDFSNNAIIKTGQLIIAITGTGEYSDNVFLGLDWATANARVFCNVHQTQNGTYGIFGNSFYVMDAFIDDSGTLRVRIYSNSSSITIVYIDYFIIR